MKVFHCDHCQHLIFFESTTCLKCQRPLAYLPEFGDVGSLDAVEGTNEYTSPLPRIAGRRFRLCENYSAYNVCNWALPADSETTFCPSCALTRTIPDLGVLKNKERWAKLETAKRRLVYTLIALNLPIAPKTEESPEGLIFDFLADPPKGTPDAKKVLTGHAEGTITLNVAEADDPEREQRRVELGEMYRTLLGHFRHEVGHYYWDRLIGNTGRLQAFRELFGNESADYGDALQNHYKNGPPADWQNRFVSSYASSHPWEDWAESWSHYLHMVDTLETAATCGLSLRPPRRNEPAFKEAPDVLNDTGTGFDGMMSSWHSITYVLNNLNRGLGLLDPYPFVVPSSAIEKLRFIHEVVQSHSGTPEEILPSGVVVG